ncbi:Glutamate synthase [NADPH] large chain [Minicystis rosea]|nr:Glutamate synthase [NADPH] large chain [Minicystis rosea]
MPSQSPKFSLFHEELRRALRELRGGRLSPVRGAAAVALGLFVGCQPVFGCHLPIIVVLCLWLRLDALIAYVAANISNPFVAPAIITAEVELGAFLRTGARPRFEHALDRATAFSFAGDLALGAPVFGLALAIGGGTLTFAILAIAQRLRGDGPPPEPYRLPPEAPPWVHAVERVAERYAPADGATAAERSRFHYVRTKLLGDPIAKLIADIEGDTRGALGEALDIGTGRGQLPILLLELGRATRARGVDWDESKIEAGKKAAHGLDIDLSQGDARTADYAPSDTVLLIDLIHYFTIEEQDLILRRAAQAVRPGGRLLVREADTERGLRSTITLLEERIFTALRFNRGERVRFRPAREIVSLLEGMGLRCEVRPAWGKTPFANVLVIGRRAAE